MKKIFISVPMRGRTEENIRKSIEKMRDCTKILLEDDVTIVNEYKPMTEPSEDVPVNWRLQKLGESISLMSLADMVVTVNGCWDYPGCSVETHAAGNYEIPVLYLPFDYICSDLHAGMEAVPCSDY